MPSLPLLIRGTWSHTLQVFKHSNEKYLFIFTRVQNVLNVRFCVILYSKRANGEQETRITQFRRSHNNAISWSSSSVLLTVRTAPADSQRTGGGRHLPTRLTAPVRNSVYVLLAKTVLIPSVSRTSHRPAGYHFRYSYEI